MLLVLLGFLIAYAVLTRRRPAQPARPQPPRPPVDADDEAIVIEAWDGEPALELGAAAAVAIEGAVAATPPRTPAPGAMACPTCRREYEGRLVFCPHDARRLVSAAELADRTRGGGSMCPRCRRAFDPGVRFCPHDAAELVPLSLHEASRDAGKSARAPAGVMAKICPQCRHRYDLSATFCAQDGSELRTIN